MMEISEQVMLYGLDDDTAICLLDDGENVLRVSDIFKEFAKARQQLAAYQWVPVGERLPENDCYYPVMLKGHIYTSAAYCCQGIWYAVNLKWMKVEQQNVTHWMPLPVQPEEPTHD